jgi:hypothetical protein
MKNTSAKGKIERTVGKECVGKRKHNEKAKWMRNLCQQKQF